jgi:hypothetical protein
MTLKDLLEKQFGVKTRVVINPMDVTAVGTSVTQILGNNPNRLAWMLVNLSPNDLYIAFERDVSVDKGIYLSPTGGTVKFLWNEDFELTGYEVWAVSTGADSAIYLVEVVTA